MAHAFLDRSWPQDDRKIGLERNEHPDCEISWFFCAKRTHSPLAWSTTISLETVLPFRAGKALRVMYNHWCGVATFRWPKPPAGPPKFKKVSKFNTTVLHELENVTHAKCLVLRCAHSFLMVSFDFEPIEIELLLLESFSPMRFCSSILNMDSLVL